MCQFHVRNALGPTVLVSVKLASRTGGSRRTSRNTALSETTTVLPITRLWRNRNPSRLVHLANPVFGRVEKPLSKLGGSDFLATVPQCSASFAISIGRRKRGISLLSGRTQAFARILSARPTKPCFPAFIYLVTCDAHASHANSGLHEDRIIAALDLQHPIERVPYTVLRDSLCPSMLVNHP
jgi:hypothetical protein